MFDHERSLQPLPPALQPARYGSCRGYVGRNVRPFTPFIADPAVAFVPPPSSGAFRVAFLGTVVPHKGVHTILDELDAAGLDAAVYRKPPAREYRRRLDGKQEAHLVALACSAPPEGRKRWTLRLLADRLAELQVIESVSYETVRQALKQTGSSRG